MITKTKSNWVRCIPHTMWLNHTWINIPIFFHLRFYNFYFNNNIKIDEISHPNGNILFRIYFNPVCHELILENSWPTTGSSKSRCFRQDVISLFFLTPDCLSFKLSVLFCFSKRFFYLCWLSISQNYTPEKKKIYTLCYFRFCLYLRILKIRLIHMLYPNNT